MIEENMSLTHEQYLDRDKVIYRNNKGQEFVCQFTTLQKCLDWEKKEGNSIVWYEINNGKRISLG